MIDFQAIGVGIGIAIVPSATVVGAWHDNRKRLRDIHELANSRLTAALDAVARLEREVGSLKELLTVGQLKKRKKQRDAG